LGKTVFNANMEKLLIAQEFLCPVRFVHGRREEVLVAQLQSKILKNDSVLLTNAQFVSLAQLTFPTSVN
jgi:hypothetical protein